MLLFLSLGQRLTWLRFSCHHGAKSGHFYWRGSNTVKLIYKCQNKILSQPWRIFFMITKRTTVGSARWVNTALSPCRQGVLDNNFPQRWIGWRESASEYPPQCSDLTHFTKRYMVKNQGNYSIYNGQFQILLTTSLYTHCKFSLPICISTMC